MFEQTTENDAPVYVRKLTRKSHWGKTEEDPDARLPFVLDQVFRRDDPREAISVYEVRNHRDLEKVAIGLNSGRSSFTEEVNLAYFTEREIADAGLTVDDTPGDTACECANVMHRDLHGNSDNYEELCRLAFSDGREAYRMKRKAMKTIKLQMEGGCTAFVADPAGVQCGLDDGNSC